MRMNLIRAVVALSVSAFAVGAGLVPSSRAEPRHGLSTFGELKYPADFKAFDYVDPSASTGGRLSLVGGAAIRTFDSFNAFILKGNQAQGLSLLYDTLMARAGDEPDSAYGLIAASADLADDRMSIVFKLRLEAKFADDSPVTADDVVFSFNSLKEKGHPSYRILMRDVTKAEALDTHTVRFSFQGTLVRDLPLTVAGLSVLPKAYYDKQPFDETTFKIPLGSGPYTISDYKQGTYIIYKRRPTYWAKDLPVNRHRFNFDELRYEYFRDRTAELESLKAGAFDLREEFTAKDWVTGYDVPAVKDGRLVKITLPDATPSGAQGWFINTRRAKFQDPRVRKALDFAFDYEWTNKNLFYGLYTRTQSYFENSEMKAKGSPSPAELALLEPFRSKLPAAVFGEPYQSPQTDGTGNDRRHLREAQKLLSEAGWNLHTVPVADPDCGVWCSAMTLIGLRSVKTDAVLRNGSGETFDIEFLAYEPTFDRVVAPYIRNLRAIGISANVRQVDSAQYELRVKTFDYDIVSSRFSMSLTPGIELRNYWASETANSEGSRNLPGIKDPVVDQLIDVLLGAKSRQELVTATRAIDRVLRAGHYWVPHWFKASHNIVYWDKFNRPPVPAKYGSGVIDTWWYDTAKAAKLPSR